MTAPIAALIADLKRLASNYDGTVRQYIADTATEAADALASAQGREAALVEALQHAGKTITALENCGVRAPCPMCDGVIRAEQSRIGRILAARAKGDGV